MLNKDLFRKPDIALETSGQAKAPVPPSVPDQLYVKCTGCGAMLPTEALADHCYVCPQCDFHFHMSARQRTRWICDPDSFVESDAGACSCDPIQFPGYPEKLSAATEKSGEAEAVVTGTARVSGVQVALFAMEPSFMMGSMGCVVGEKITRLFEYATEQRLPVLGFTVSGGARMQEGIFSLMQMAKTSGAVRRHSDAGCLYIAVLTDPTTGGVTASFAMEGDIILAEPGALIAFAGPRVIEQTTKQTLPPGFQRAEFLLKNGFVDALAPRTKQKEMIAALLALHAGGAAL